MAERCASLWEIGQHRSLTGERGVFAGGQGAIRRPRKSVFHLPVLTWDRQRCTSTRKPAWVIRLSKAGSGATDQKAAHPMGRNAARAWCKPVAIGRAAG